MTARPELPEYEVALLDAAHRASLHAHSTTYADVLPSDLAAVAAPTLGLLTPRGYAVLVTACAAACAGPRNFDVQAFVRAMAAGLACTGDM